MSELSAIHCHVKRDIRFWVYYWNIAPTVCSRQPIKFSLAMMRHRIGNKNPPVININFIHLTLTPENFLKHFEAKNPQVGAVSVPRSVSSRRVLRHTSCEVEVIMISRANIWINQQIAHEATAHTHRNSTHYWWCRDTVKLFVRSFFESDQSNDLTGVNYPQADDFSLWSFVRYIQPPFVLVCLL